MRGLRNLKWTVNLTFMRSLFLLPCTSENGEHLDLMSKGQVQDKADTSIPQPIVHVRYINIITSIPGFRVKILNYLSFLYLSVAKKHLDTKKTSPNIEFCPESLGSMLQLILIYRTWPFTAGVYGLVFSSLIGFFFVTQ